MLGLLLYYVDSVLLLLFTASSLGEDRDSGTFNWWLFVVNLRSFFLLFFNFLELFEGS